MRAAVLAPVRQQYPARLVVAVPVGAPDSCQALRDIADEVVCPAMHTPFVAVGWWYRDFSQTPDEEVVGLLARARRVLDAAADRSFQNNKLKYLLIDWVR